MHSFIDQWINLYLWKPNIQLPLRLRILQRRHFRVYLHLLWMPVVWLSYFLVCPKSSVTFHPRPKTEHTLWILRKYLLSLWETWFVKYFVENNQIYNFKNDKIRSLIWSNIHFNQCWANCICQIADLVSWNILQRKYFNLHLNIYNRYVLVFSSTNLLTWTYNSLVPVWHLSSHSSDHLIQSYMLSNWPLCVYASLYLRSPQERMVVVAAIGKPNLMLSPAGINKDNFVIRWNGQCVFFFFLANIM